jgi:predicted outer membrane protein
MENQSTQQNMADQIYDYAATMLFQEKKSEAETKQALMAQGLDANSAATVVNNLQQQLKQIKKGQGNKDMLFGALWCVGGIIATMSDLGFIFW